MSGSINNAPAPSAASSAGSELNNPLLAQAEQQLESNLTAENKADYEKIVTAGLHIALQGGPSGFMARLAKSKDPIGDCAKGAASLVLIMRKQSRGVMPMKSAIPAGTSLMLHGLDFIDRAKIAKVGEPEIDRASTTYVNFMFHKLGITPGMVQHLAGRVHTLTQDPASMQAIQMKAGLLRHPGAATPTPLPPGPGGPAGMINGGGAVA